MCDRILSCTLLYGLPSNVKMTRMQALYIDQWLARARVIIRDKKMEDIVVACVGGWVNEKR